MHWQSNPYALTLIISAIVSIATTVYAWRRRPAAGVAPMVLFLLAAAAWSLSYALELGSTDLAAKVFWARVQYFGIVTVAPAMLVLVLQYLSLDRWLTRRNVALLATIPLVTLLLVWTNELHGLIWKEVQPILHEPYLMLNLQHGTFFWVFLAYCYACLVTGTVLLLRAYRRSLSIYRAQTTIILSGTLVPWVANAVYLFGGNPFPYLDLTPFGFTISGLIVTWGLFHYQLLDVVPIARHIVMENMGDSVIVLDEQARVVDINPAAQKLLGCDASEVTGRQAKQVFSRWPDLVERYGDVREAHVQISIDDEDVPGYYDLRISFLSDRRGEYVGRAIVLRNTSKLMQDDMALRQQQQQLEAQNVELRKLSRAVEQSANAVMITDLEGHIEYVNPRFTEMTGYSIEEVLGQTPRIFSPDEQAAEPYDDMWRIIRSGQEWQGELPSRRKDGTAYWEQATISPVYDATGEMTHFVAVREDITNQKRTAEALTRLLELSRVLASIRDMDIALGEAVNSAIEIVPTADRCTVQWLDRDGRTLRTVAFSETCGERSDVPPYRPGEGIAGHALVSREIINVPDVVEDERFVPGKPPLLFRSLLVAPLIVRDRALGTLSLSSERIAAFSSTDETLTGLVADQIGAALETAQELTARRQAEEALYRYAERLRILHEIDQSILAARLPETIAVAAIGRIRHLIPCQRAMVMALEETQQIKLLAAESRGEIKPVDSIDIYQELFEERTLNSGWVRGVEDLSALPRPSPLHESLLAAGIRAYVVVPLFIQGELVGTLNLESEYARAFTADHVSIATEVAALLAVAIRQARLYAQAQQEIADRMQAEEALRKYTVELEAQNAELGAFAHTVAHDLKIPLTTLVGYAQVLEQSDSILSEEALKESLRIIAQNGQKMGDIIDDLLLLASVREKDEIETKVLDMAEIVSEAQGRLVHMIEESQADIIEPETWPAALGYGPWVEAVWANYISNALKFGGKPPRVELGATEQPDGQVRFWVRDNGQGLSSQQVAHLFTPFERLHQVRIRGHGLGLSIVQRIVQKLGGEVGVEGNGVHGQGSTFYFTLPALTPSLE